METRLASLRPLLQDRRLRSLDVLTEPGGRSAPARLLKSGRAVRIPGVQWDGSDWALGVARALGRDTAAPGEEDVGVGKDGDDDDLAGLTRDGVDDETMFFVCVADSWSNGTNCKVAKASSVGFGVILHWLDSGWSLDYDVWSDDDDR